MEGGRRENVSSDRPRHAEISLARVDVHRVPRFYVDVARGRVRSRRVRGAVRLRESRVAVHRVARKVQAVVRRSWHQEQNGEEEEDRHGHHRDDAAELPQQLRGGIPRA